MLGSRAKHRNVLKEEEACILSNITFEKLSVVLGKT
jgi:hypothetical protein